MHYYIDLHSHILFGIDDGPTQIEQSLAMASGYVKAGYRIVVATPHRFDTRLLIDAKSQIEERLQELNGAIAEQGLALTVLSGMEVDFGSEILKEISDGRIFTLGGSRYVLIETPFEQFPLGWEQCLFQLVSGGYSVLLGHPERCLQLMRRPEMLDTLADIGVYLQVNFESLLGAWGRSVQKLAHRLISEGRIHCLATDSHDADQRSPHTATKVFDTLGSVYGEKTLLRLASENPQRVLNSQRLLPIQPTEPPEPSVLDRAARWWQNARKMMVG